MRFEQVRAQPSVVVIGGGTGSFTLLSALKYHIRDLTALVNMADDGGSTGQLRDELGVLPPGDVRQCLVAMSEAEHLRDVFAYRFPGSGALGGHTFGNLFLSAVEKMTDDFGEAVSLASEVLRIHGRVLPITLEECRLVYRSKAGEHVRGEHKIEETDISDDQRPFLYYEKSVSINPKAKKAILEADMVIIAPGSLYTSLIPPLMVNGVPAALKATNAQVVYVANLINKAFDTRGYAVHDYVRELERYAGKGVIDVVLYNTDKPTKAVLDRYAKDDEFPVIVDQEVLDKAPYKAIPGAFLSKRHPEVDSGDPLADQRSLIRHNAEAVAKALVSL